MIKQIEICPKHIHLSKFNCLYLGFRILKEKRKTLKSPLIYVFITMAHTAQNSTKIKLQKNLQIMNSKTKF